MNAVLFHSYSTMHITPEEGSSYASFETNQKLKNYTPLISNVVRAFRPKRFVMTLMADEGGLKEMGKNPLFTGGSGGAKIAVPFNKKAGSIAASPASSLAAGGNNKNHNATYKRRDLASIQVEDDVCCMMGSWVLDESDVTHGEFGSREKEQTEQQRPRGLSVSHYS
mmetsp:Transcript_21357/g.34707  ORF Transcript_21357/g.34707 Transcript_21357/m.34707 type:complete len:167 (+) Transcript_21357:193-693(+)